MLLLYCTYLRKKLGESIGLPRGGKSFISSGGVICSVHAASSCGGGAGNSILRLGGDKRCS